MWRSLLLRMGILERRETWDSCQVMAQESLFIPAGAELRGSFSSNLPVILEGQVDGGISVEGGECLTVLEGARVSNGQACAAIVYIHGEVRNAVVEGQSVVVAATGSVSGQSARINYGRLTKDGEAVVEGLLTKTLPSTTGAQSQAALK